MENKKVKNNDKIRIIKNKCRIPNTIPSDAQIMEQMEILGGNTNTPRIQQAKRWCFTYNNYTEFNYECIKNEFKILGIQYIIGKEVGANGTPHLQGYIECNKKIRWSQLGLMDGIHWERAKGDQAANIKYCSKDGNYDCTHSLEPIKCIHILKDWQKKVLEIALGKPDGRSIYWIIDRIGGKGKSSFCKYLYVHHDIPTIQGGKLGDIVNVVYNMRNMPITLCIDIPRNNGNAVSYSAIENILNGMIFNTKFETGIRVFNPPNIIVYCNFAPDIECMSIDRWKIIDLDI